MLLIVIKKCYFSEVFVILCNIDGSQHNIKYDLLYWLLKNYYYVIHISKSHSLNTCPQWYGTSHVTYNASFYTTPAYGNHDKNENVNNATIIQTEHCYSDLILKL